jgi:hypothetical protein
MNSKLAVLTLFLSLSSFGGVSIEEKENRVDFIESLGPVAPSVGIEAYRRELEYERLGLSIEERAKNEANLLAEKVKSQISLAFDAAIEKHGDPSTAAFEIRKAIEKDLELADPELKEELKSLSFSALRELEQGGSTSYDAGLDSMVKILIENVEERSQYLNRPDATGVHNGSAFNMNPFMGDAAIKLEYSSKEDLVEALVSSEQSSQWVSTANMSVKSAEINEDAAKVSLQVKIEFLGVTLEAGPKITFKRKYSTHASVMAEGLNPILLANGNFDFYKSNNQKRFIFFFCDASLSYETEYQGAGGFKVAGVGAEGSISKQYQNSVTLTSRRLHVPISVGNKTVNLNLLSQICHRSFLGASISSDITVEDSLNVMMKNSLAGLRYTHPKTKCAIDRHCYSWYNNEVLALVKLNTFPRCVEQGREKYNACTLRGLKGQNCAVYKNGRRVSDGMFEYTCDKGLKCVQVKQEGWFKDWELYQFAKGKCMPINSRTYRSPFENP